MPYAAPKPCTHPTKITYEDKTMFHVPDEFRLKTGYYASTKEDGNNGVFYIKTAKFKRQFKTIASQGNGWEHVSISFPDRCPTWDEMCYIKSVFWDSEDLVVQLHPPESEYVNCHPYCLHLWRKVYSNNFCELPPSIMVGPKY